MAQKVKRASKRRGDKPAPRRARHTRVSRKHQVTIPREPFAIAGLRPGDTLKVEAEGPGKVTLTRLDELLAKYRGALRTGGELRERVESVRDEWR